MVGLKQPIAAFLRMKNAIVLGNMTEVPLPTRFIFVLLAPPVSIFFCSKDIYKSYKSVVN